MNEPVVCMGFTPDWPVSANIGSFISYRKGGGSTGPFASNNMAAHVGDDPQTVESNRRRLCNDLSLPRQPLWLTQVHGTKVVDASSDQGTEADGCISRQAGDVCAVLTADCLPILLCDQRGTQVAAIHGGWRGLAGGIVAECLGQFKHPRGEIMAFLGPAISAPVYEVGQEVVDAFTDLPVKREVYAQINSQRPGHYFLDLYAVARLQLQQQKVNAIYGGDRCSYREPKHFYSYRRDGQTGRMASLIWIKSKNS